MLEIYTKKSHWRRNLVILIALGLLAAGVYLLVVVFSPASSIPTLTGRGQHETLQKLEKAPGSYGDRLYIPDINVDVAIVKGSNSSALEKGAWHRKPENGDPEKGGNFVLSAHRFVMSMTPQGTALKSPFYNIGNVAIDDTIYVDYHGKRYEYIVKEKYSVKPDATDIEAATDEPRLTLYSCTLEGSSDGRDVLTAVPVAPSDEADF